MFPDMEPGCGYTQRPVLLLQYHKQTTVAAYMEQQGSGFHTKSAAPH